MQAMHIVVDEKGYTRAERGAPNAQVCLRSDPEAFFRFYLSHFGAPVGQKSAAEGDRAGQTAMIVSGAFRNDFAFLVQVTGTKFW